MANLILQHIKCSINKHLSLLIPIRDRQPGGFAYLKGFRLTDVILPQNGYVIQDPPSSSKRKAMATYSSLLTQGQGICVKLSVSLDTMAFE